MHTLFLVIFSKFQSLRFCPRGDAIIQWNISLINKQNTNSDNIFNIIKEVNYLSIEENNSQEKILYKICYSEQIDFINNPMVHLCNCKGYLNYAHFDCIKQK